MKILGILFILIFAGCAQTQPLKLEFSCVSIRTGDQVTTNCADPDTWREWIEKQSNPVR